jgi:predicted RNA-binding Zn ribbon-like protein
MESPAPIVVGGHPALDFLNTIASPRGEPVEYMADGAALLRWLVASGLVGEAEVRRLLRRFSAAELDAVARQAVALREWLRPIVQRSAASGAAKVSGGELQALNAVLARGSRRLEIARRRGGYLTRHTLQWDSARELLVPVGDAIAELLSTVDFGLVRNCGAPACTLWFLDRTKGHRRQWCSMEVCGNRAKVRAHRRRARVARAS